MSEGIQNQIIIMSLKPLFEQAEAENLWFYHSSMESGEVWASPEYLRLMHTKGRLIWAPEHWELRNPVGYLKSLHRQAKELINEYNDLAERLNIPNVLLLEEQDMTPVSESVGSVNYIDLGSESR